MGRYVLKGACDGVVKALTGGLLRCALDESLRRCGHVQSGAVCGGKVLLEGLSEAVAVCCLLSMQACLLADKLTLALRKQRAVFAAQC